MEEGKVAYTIENIGPKIKKCRLEKKLTQEQLAERLSIGPNYLGQIENGKRGMNLMNIVKIVNELDMSFEYLLSDSSDSNISSGDTSETKWSKIIKDLSPKEQEIMIEIAESVRDILFPDMQTM